MRMLELDLILTKWLFSLIKNWELKVENLGKAPLVFILMVSHKDAKDTDK